MPRPRKKPTCDAEKIAKDLMAAVVECYEETGELKLTAEEFDMSALKIRKLLITAGAYSNDVSDEVNRLYESGKSVEEIQKIMGLGKSSVNGYLPYTKSVYKPDELSLNAERIAIFRKRKQVVKRLNESLSEDDLWDAVVLFQNYPFHTISGLPFKYELRVGQNGKYNKELIVNRRRNSKSVVWSSVSLAFRKALVLRGEIIKRPKDLGDIRGISYIYPMLYRFGLIDVPEEVAGII